MLFLFFIACTNTLPEDHGLNPILNDAWGLTCADILLENGTLSIRSNSNTFTFKEVVGSPSIENNIIVFAHAPIARPDTILVLGNCNNDNFSYDTLVNKGNPDRPVLSDDTTKVAYFSGETGISALYVVDTVSKQSKQLNNFDKVNFEQPPVTSPSFKKGLISWKTPSGDLFERRP